MGCGFVLAHGHAGPAKTSTAQILHCCPGTLRRALKILLEKKLIEYVETNKLRERIYRLPTEIENPPEPPFEKVGPKVSLEKVRSETVTENPSKSPFAKGDLKMPIVEAEPEILTPEKDENGNDKLLCISWNPGRALNMGDKDFLDWAQCVDKQFVTDYRQKFPSLNGTNSKPRIDLSLIQYLVMTNTHLGLVGVCSHIKKTLWEYANNQFVPKADMHVEWR